MAIKFPGEDSESRVQQSSLLKAPAERTRLKTDGHSKVLASVTGDCDEPTRKRNSPCENFERLGTVMAPTRKMPNAALGCVGLNELPPERYGYSDRLMLSPKSVSSVQNRASTRSIEKLESDATILNELPSKSKTNPDVGSIAIGVRKLALPGEADHGHGRLQQRKPHKEALTSHRGGN